MFEGIYTGGTPNFVAIKMALDVDPNLFVMISTYDMIVGARTCFVFCYNCPTDLQVYTAPVFGRKGHLS